MVHGIPLGITRLTDNTHSPGYDTLAPCKHGQNTTAVFTFAGRELPRQVVCQGGDLHH